MSITMKPITTEDPKLGEEVVLCNAVRTWVTNWNPALAGDLAVCPATHYARVTRPYPPTAPDKTKLRERDAYEVVRLARKRAQK